MDASATDILERYTAALNALGAQERRVADVDASLRTLRIHCQESTVQAIKAFAYFEDVLERQRAELSALSTVFDAVEDQRVASKAALKDAMRAALGALGTLLSVEPVATLASSEQFMTEVAKAVVPDSVSPNLQLRSDPPVAGVYKDGFRTPKVAEDAASTDRQPPLANYAASSNCGSTLEDAFTFLI